MSSFINESKRLEINRRNKMRGHSEEMDKHYLSNYTPLKVMLTIEEIMSIQQRGIYTMGLWL